MARYFDGTTTIPKVADVHLNGDQLHFEDKIFKLDQVAVSHISEREINLIASGMTIEISKDDPEFQSIYHAIISERKSRQKRGLALAMSSLGIMIVAFLIFPVVAQKIPDNYYKMIIPENTLISFFPDTCKLPDELNEMLLNGSGEKGYQFYVMKLPMVNAFAYPMNQIHITKGMLLKLNSDDELMAIVGHELGHLKLRHYKSHLARMLFIDVVSSVLDQGQAGNLAHTMILNSYSREHEREADQFAVDVLRNKGLPLEAGASVMELLQKEVPDFGPSILSSHPVTKERIDFFRKASQGIKVKLSSDKTLINKIISNCKLR